MASHAHAPSDSVSAAKVTAYGGIGVALIGAVVATINLVGSHNGVSTGPTSTTISQPSLTQKSDRGSVDEVEINGSASEVTVTGSAEKDVDSVAVLIGPRESGGQQFWANTGKVFNQQWKLSVATEPHLLQPYTIEAHYHSLSAAVPQGRRLSEFAFKRTDPTTPAPPANPIVNCAEQFGPDCFTGPDWGPPSVYQSK